MLCVISVSTEASADWVCTGNGDVPVPLILADTLNPELKRQPLRLCHPCFERQPPATLQPLERDKTCAGIWSSAVR